MIRARLRTLGVQEYRFIFDHGKCDPSTLNFAYASLLTGRTMGREWRLYDVGGTRSNVSPVELNPSFKLITVYREEHGIHISMTVSSVCQPLPSLLIYSVVDAIIFLA